jgi:3-deoxy-D-manno-octulosonic-acid transferase
LSTDAPGRDPPPSSIPLRLYLAAARRGGSVARRVLERRQREGKEHPERLPERMGIAGRPRPEG